MKRSPEYDRWLAANIAYSEQYNVMVQDSEKLKTQYPSMSAKINTRLDAFEEFFQATDALVKDMIARTHLQDVIVMVNAKLMQKELNSMAANSIRQDEKYQKICENRDLLSMDDLQEIKDKNEYIRKSIGL